MMGGEKQLTDPNCLLRNLPPSEYIHKTNKYNQMMKIIFTEILPSSVYFSGSKVKQRQVDCTCLSLGIIRDLGYCT